MTTDASTVALSISPGTPTSGGPGTLAGCSQSETAGVITFSGCSINTVGTGYKLHVTDGTLTAADSGAFNITAGQAAKLAFTQQPSNSTTGVAFATPPKVSVEDSLGNVVTTDSSTASLTITPSTPTSGGPGTLSGCSAIETNGVFTFSGCSINAAGTAYKLRAMDGTLTLADSAAFNVSTPPLAVVSITSTNAGGLITPGTSTQTITFNNPLDPAHAPPPTSAMSLSLTCSIFGTLCTTDTTL